VVVPFAVLGFYVCRNARMSIPIAADRGGDSSDADPIGEDD
jgi:hypothetical protein